MLIQTTRGNGARLEIVPAKRCTSTQDRQVAGKRYAADGWPNLVQAGLANTAPSATV